MFTGLVQRVGKFQGLRRRAGGWSLDCAHEPWETALEIGESVAVQGACLTVIAVTAYSFSVDVLDETLARTALGSLTPQAPVNLERALRLGDRLGGHIVTGHIDTRGMLTVIQERGRDKLLRVRCSFELAQQTVLKGSVALDGISLTVSDVGADWFEVNIIPHTWKETSLRVRRVGDLVNIEGDILAKYVAKLCGKTGSTLDEAALLKAGFGAQE